ncbi:MAG: glutamate synthase-related protein, partial [Candidatus Altarchaeaceae archaeon]
PEEFKNSLSKFIVERNDNCTNCGKCEKVCVYKVHNRSKEDMKKMAEPVSKLCRGCFRCVQECPIGALSIRINPEFKKIGGSYWKPEIIFSIFKQANDGKVPVSGAGYGGPFTGSFFDSMWTDMSEIVRPTRDGIHGREYINTMVEIGRKLSGLKFDKNKNLEVEVPKVVPIPLPIIFDVSSYDLGKKIGIYSAIAANELNTYIIFDVNDINTEIIKYSQNIIPLISYEDFLDIKNKKGEIWEAILMNSKMIEIRYSDEILYDLKTIREISKNLSKLIIVRIPLRRDLNQKVIELARNEIDAVHIVGNHRGKEEIEIPDDQKQFIADILRNLHLELVENSIRDNITIIVSGGIASAEHVPKAMLCGADAVAVDIVLAIALGNIVYDSQQNILIEFKNSKEQLSVSVQKIINLIGAWHLQLLEVMGAMGIREARRLRGEIGRAIFFNDIDEEIFGEIFKK